MRQNNFNLTQFKYNFTTCGKPKYIITRKCIVNWVDIYTKLHKIHKNSGTFSGSHSFHPLLFQIDHKRSVVTVHSTPWSNHSQRDFQNSLRMKILSWILKFPLRMIWSKSTVSSHQRSQKQLTMGIKASWKLSYIFVNFVEFVYWFNL